jgi:hypothetical protein
VRDEARTIADSITGESHQTIGGLRQAQVRINALNLAPTVDELETLKDEIESWRDNMPENLQGSEKYNTLDETANLLEGVIGELGSLQPPNLQLPEKDQDVDLERTKAGLGDLAAALRQYAEAIDSQTIELENAEFPGMMG